MSCYTSVLMYTRRICKCVVDEQDKRLSNCRVAMLPDKSQLTNRCNSTNVEGDDGQSAYTYNVRGEVKQIQHFDPSDNELYGITYTRDGAGNPLAVGFSSGWYCPTAYSGKTVSYAYDEMSRLISEQVGTNTAKRGLMTGSATGASHSRRRIIRWISLPIITAGMCMTVWAT